MSISFIAGAIVITIVCAFIISSLSYQRQKAIAQKRKEIKHYKSVAMEISGYRDFIEMTDHEFDLLSVLQKQIVVALENVLERVPSDEHILRASQNENARLKQFRDQQRHQEVSLIMRSDDDLKSSKQQLAKIAKHLEVCRNAGSLPDAICMQLKRHITHLGHEIDFESHYFQAQQCAIQGDVVLYQTHLKQSRDALKKTNLEQDIKNGKLKDISDKLSEVKRTNKVILDAPDGATEHSEDSTSSPSSSSKTF